ncbi:hypothetical protein M3P05_00575 [Sansalvadorimonas sp. 2012CJ34-2]|uniref:Uncharacterized protein n=1 Tax=Parendozoicomonas callyspongiae TaxID=2942213 RepID=A0ABT0PAM4_9GAMM|nr:hypothetical protein [Sansalvadorimonas sp. 2012CJ34-2]MCL6268444.1 hypothetical protein [Sansalvadorimonas sp. 2012CJ34-2]
MKLLTAITTIFLCLPALAAAVDIHPLCIEEMIPLHSPASEKSASVDLKACSEKYKSYPFSKEGHWQAVWSKSQMKEEPEDESIPVYSSYSLIGGMENNQVLLQQVVNYGGSGTFTFAMLVEGISLSQNQQHAKTLKMRNSFPGGDRCLGGIHDLTITSPNSVTVSRNITTAELMRYGQSKKAAQSISAGLPDCAICCIGTAQENWTLDGKTKLVSVSLAPRERSNGESRKTKCLYDLLRGEDDVRLELTKEDLASLQQEYINQCLKQGSAYIQ